MSKFIKNSALTPYTPGEQPKDKSYIKLNTNESPFPPSPFAARLAREAAGDMQLYPDPTCSALRETASDKLGIPKDNIIFTNGSDEILNFAFMAYCDAKTPAAFPDITYGFYPVFAKLNGVPYEEIPLNSDFSINVNDYMGIGKTIFIANPNAPTGIALSVDEIEKIVTTNPDNIVVIDEAYVDFGAESAVCLTEKYNNILVCRTFSKSRSLAGGRLGFGIANPEIIRDLETIRYSTNPYNINRMTMAAGIGALSDDKYFSENCRRIIKTREDVKLKMKEMGFELTDSKANFIFAKHNGIGGLDLYQKLKENGVLVRHFETKRLKDYNRITVGSDAEMQEFLRVTAKILEENA